MIIMSIGELLSILSGMRLSEVSIGCYTVTQFLQVY